MTNTDLENRFKYHAPQGDQAERYDNIRRELLKTAEFILARTPASREQTMAITSLEKAMFWANASIARNESNEEKVQAKDETELDTIKAVMAMAVEAPQETGTSEIQWMPPGESEITAQVNGQPGRVKVKASAGTAELVNRRIAEMIAADAAGESVRPYIDFDHKDGEASGWPVSARWAGEDKKTGGVRLTVEWSDLGRTSVRGKRFQAFSPEFLFNRKTSEVTDVGLNLGGLVNRPAFIGIQKVSAKSEPAGGAAGEETQQPAAGANPIMKDLLKVLAACCLISRDDLSETAAVGEISARSADIKEGLQVRAKLSTDYVPKAVHDEVVTQLAAARKGNAELVVAKAVSEGRIAPKDDKTKAKFVELISKDPANAELLESLPVGKVPAQVVQGAGKDRTVNGNELEQGDEFATLVKAKMTEKNISEHEAQVIVASENPKAYDSYRAEIAKKGGVA